MMSSKEILEITDKYGSHNYKPLPVVITKAEGIWVEDPEGKRYMDMLSAYSAVNQGHRHPRIVAALKSQADRVTLVSRAFHNDQLGPFMKELCELTGMEMVLPMNTGAEAVETAVKTARKWGYTKKGVEKDRAEIVVCADNFHGRTTTIVSFSSEPQYKEGFGPLTPGFVMVPYGDAQALERAITKNTVGFLCEPIQGEAGVVVPPEGYLKAAREICSRQRVLLMWDEIQTGFCRTGKMFCYQYEDAKPDILILGKALGGGILPISAVVASGEILGVFKPGDHGSTFGGNPLACAVARESLRVLVDERLAAKAAELGAYFMQELRMIHNPMIQEVRGKGLLIGLVLKPEAGGARKYCEQLKDEGILCKETHEHVIRFAPPLMIQKKDIDWALERVRKVL
jgi:ornithine--oxo-acid transaminase